MGNAWATSVYVCWWGFVCLAVGCVVTSGDAVAGSRSANKGRGDHAISRRGIALVATRRLTTAHTSGGEGLASLPYPYSCRHPGAVGVPVSEWKDLGRTVASRMLPPLILAKRGDREAAGERERGLPALICMHAAAPALFPLPASPPLLPLTSTKREPSSG